MEKSDRRVVVLCGDPGWYDVGIWDTVFEFLGKDENSNVISGGNNLLINTHQALIINNSGRPIVTVDIDDLNIVDTGDALLVSRRGHTQKAREVINMLKEQGFDDLL